MSKQFSVQAWICILNHHIAQLLPVSVDCFTEYSIRKNSVRTALITTDQAVSRVGAGYDHMAVNYRQYEVA